MKNIKLSENFGGGEGYTSTKKCYNNIQEEIKISKYQHVTFAENMKLGELYGAMKEHWRLDRDNCEVFAASLFYNLGRVHGIREERARKRGGVL